MEPKYIPCSWYEYPANKPYDTGEYYCVCLIPDNEGGCTKCQRVLKYDSNYSGKWNCGNVIVTHWMLQMPMP